MNLNLCLLFFLVYIFCQLDTRASEKVSYIGTERPKVVYFNKKFVRNVTVTSRRHNRYDLLYYINFDSDVLLPLGNEVSVDLLFYEFRMNRYFRTFVEIHTKLCDFYYNSNLFGDGLKKMATKHTCPFAPGIYNFHNLTIPLQSIPESFPFKQGRLWVNSSVYNNGVNEHLFEAHIELEVRVVNRNRFVKSG